jgi:hypothetical protein
MDKVVTIEIIKKSLLFIFVLIAAINLLALVSAYYTGDFSIIINSYIYMSLLIIMIISAIVVKYIGDIAILSLDKSRLKKN